MTGSPRPPGVKKGRCRGCGKRSEVAFSVRARTLHPDDRDFRAINRALCEDCARRIFERVAAIVRAGTDSFN